MDPTAARKHLTPARVALALCAGASRAGTVARPHTTLVHGLVEQSRRGIFPTFDAFVTSFTSIPFQPDTSAFPGTNRYTGIDFPQVFDISPATTVADLLRILISGSIASPHALSAALELLEPAEFRASTGFQRNSIVDRFIREAFVAFASLDFSGITGLQEAVAAYARGESPEDALNVSGDGECIDASNATTVDAFPFPRSIARTAVASLVSGTPIPRDSDFAALHALHAAPPLHSASAGPALTDAAFAVQLEAARRRDGRLAAEALHRVYDLALGARGRGSPPPTSPVPSLTPSNFLSRAGPPPPAPAAERAQYAALALAGLRASLGDFALAAGALDDAVRAAQHAGDDWAQRCALGLLVRTARSPARRTELLARASDPVAQAEEDLRAPRPAHAPGLPPAAEISRSAARARRINKLTGPAGGARGAAPLLVAARAWVSHASAPTGLCVARSALVAARAERGVSTSAGRSNVSAAEAAALCAVASLEALEGAPARAIESLDKALAGRLSPVVEDEFAGGASSPFPELDHLRCTRTWLSFQHCVARRDLAAATARLAEIEAFASCPAGAGGCPLVAHERRLDAIEAKAVLFLARGDCDAACQAAQKLRTEAASCALPERALEGARLAAVAHLQAGSESAALPLALGAVAISRELGFAAAHVKVTLVLAETVFLVDGGREGACAAWRILLPILARALGGMGCAVRGYARRLSAQIGIAKCASASPTNAEYAEAIEELEDALKAYKAIDDVAGIRDCSYLLARIRNARGETKERDEMAFVFREQVNLIQQHAVVLA